MVGWVLWVIRGGARMVGAEAERVGYVVCGEAARPVVVAVALWLVVLVVLLLGARISAGWAPR